MADRTMKWRPIWNAGAAFLKKLNIPTSAGDPAGVTDGEIWLDTGAGKLAARLAGNTILVPLASEIGTSGLSQEQIEDFMALMIQDNADIDWTYTDNAAGAGALVGVIKPAAITYAKIQNVAATSRVLGRIAAGAGTIEELTGANLKTIIGVLANADLANMAQGTFKGRSAGSGTGAPVDMTAATAKTALAIVPADVTMAAEAKVLGRAVGAGAGVSQELTAAQLLAILGAIDATTLGGLTVAGLQAQIVNAISNGAGAAYDTLIEIQNFLQADDTADAALVTSVGLRSRFAGLAIPAGATPQNVAHGMALGNIGDFHYRTFVAATGVNEDYEVTPVDANTVAVSDESGTAIPAGRRIFMTFGA